MKKKFFAVLLSCVCAVFLLTGCGGGMTEAELTSMVNRNLANSDMNIQLTYDSSLNNKAITALNVYLSTGDSDAALIAAGLDNQNYYMVESYPFESYSTSATYISSNVLYYAAYGKVGKRIGYAAVSYKNGQKSIVALVACF